MGETRGCGDARRSWSQHAHRASQHAQRASQHAHRARPHGSGRPAPHARGHGAIPHRRSGPLPWRLPLLPWPSRPAGEAQRASHRVGADRRRHHQGNAPARQTGRRDAHRRPIARLLCDGLAADRGAYLASLDRHRRRGAPSLRARATVASGAARCDVATRAAKDPNR